MSLIQLPINYDWTYNAMTLEERIEISNLAKNRSICGNYFRDATIANPTPSSIFSNEVFSSHYFETMLPFYAGLAFWGDGTIDADADKAVDSFYPTMLNYGYLDAQNFVAGEDGGYSEWIGYSRWHPRTHLLLMDAWRTATGKNFLNDREKGTVSGNSIRNYPYLVTYVIDPYKYNDKYYTFLPSGTESTGIDNYVKEPFLQEQLIFLPRALSESGLGKEAGLLRDFYEKYGLQIWKYQTYLFGFLGVPKSVPTVSPEDAGLPKSRWFKNMGAFFAKQGFSNQGDGVISISGAHYNFGGHQGIDDYGGFSLVKYGQLVTTRECCSKNHGTLDDYIKGYQNNLIYFISPLTKEERGTEENVYTRTELQNAVTGKKNYDLGGIEEVVKKNGEFYYIRVNDSRRYISGAGISHDREHVWFPGNDSMTDSDFLVVYDRVSGPELSQWVYHVPWEPDIFNFQSKDDLTNGANETSRIGTGYNGNLMTLKELGDKGDYFDDSTRTKNFTGGGGGPGVLFAKALLPNQQRLEITRQANITFATRNQGNLGVKMSRWQVAILPQAYSPNERFLNVLQTANKNKVSQMAWASLIQTPEMQGAFIERENSLRPNFIVLFTRNGGINDKAISYTINGEGETKHVITGLKPRTLYEIRDNGNLIEKNMTEGDVELWDYKGVAENIETGVLYFVTNLGSEHTITISEGELPLCAAVSGDICSLGENCMNGNVNLGFIAASDSSRCCTAPGNCTVPPAPQCWQGAVISNCSCGGVEISDGYCCSGVWSEGECFVVRLPLAPSNLIAALVGEKVSLTWEDKSDNEEEFVIERSVDGVNWEEAGRVGAEIRSWEDSGILLGPEERGLFERIFNELGKIVKRVIGYFVWE